MGDVRVVKGENGRNITCELYVEDKRIARAEIGVDNEKRTYTIVARYVIDGYKHMGYGKMALQFLFDELDRNYGVNYIWDGANEYVGDWLRKFDAVCTVPLVVMKTQAEDDWESHIYRLNAKKFFEYLNT